MIIPRTDELIWIAVVAAGFLGMAVVAAIFITLLGPGEGALDVVLEILLTPLLVSAVALLSAGISAATYYELKRIKEGDQSLADIFR